MLSSAGRNLTTGLAPVQENLPDIENKQDTETYSTEGGGGGAEEEEVEEEEEKL